MKLSIIIIILAFTWIATAFSGPGATKNFRSPVDTNIVITADKDTLLISCDTVVHAYHIPAFSRKNILFTSTFESGFAEWKNTQHCCSYSTGISSNFARAGSKSMRIELRKGDADVAASKRAELTLNSEASNTVERWYGVSFYLPTAFVADNTNCPEVLFQWHQPSSPGPPPLALWLRGPKFYINQYNIANKADALTEIGSLVNNQWIDFVFHIKWSPKSTGLVEIWVGGVKVYTRAGVNNYGDNNGNYLKTGIYKWGWKNGYTTTQTSRVLYIDEVRIGGPLATYDDVAPGN